MQNLIGLIRATVVAGAALLAVPVHADVYRFSWGYRWAEGQILHDASVADSDPSPDREVYVNSILGFDMRGLRESDFTFPTLSGSGGTIVIDRGPTSSGNIDTITFMFGAAVSGDPSIYQLVASFYADQWAGPYAIDQPWTADLAGSVFRDGELYFVGMTPGYGTLHELVATVPEPAGWALIGVALAGVATVGRRKRG